MTTTTQRKKTKMTDPTIKYTGPSAIEYAYADDAGADLRASEAVTIEPGKRALVHTGIRAVIPDGYQIEIRSRSGLALTSGVHVLNAPGTIDAGYQGEIGVILHNSGEEDYIIRVGDRVAQAVVMPYVKAHFHHVKHDGTRSNNGFGSTGK